MEDMTLGEFLTMLWQLLGLIPELVTVPFRWLWNLPMHTVLIAWLVLCLIAAPIYVWGAHRASRPEKLRS